LQAGIYNGLNGHAGLAGWRWLFSEFRLNIMHSHSAASYSVTVINGVISLPIAILAYFFLPDTPGTAKANWLFSERVSITLFPNKPRKVIDNHFPRAGDRNC
jgi:ACS family pantothenate transporter-like MFS transporter